MSGSDNGFCGILLAAGRSTRFGSDKLLHPLADGTPIALASARAMLAAIPRVVAVVKRDNPVLARLLAAEDIEVIAAPTVGECMGRSIAACIQASACAAGWVVALADMPFIRSHTISLVLAALENGAPLAAPAFRGQRGHPVGFSSRFRERLSVLQNDEGARHILREHQDQLDLIECMDAGIIRDIDLPGDLPPITANNPPPWIRGK